MRYPLRRPAILAGATPQIHFAANRNECQHENTGHPAKTPPAPKSHRISSDGETASTIRRPIPFCDLRDDGVSECYNSVHEIGNPISISDSSGR